MITGQDLFNERQYKIDELSASISKLAENGRKLALAERDYKIALSKKALELKSKGMAVTLIDKVIYGVEEIAELRFNRDVAEVLYNANQEHINSTKLQLRLLDNQIGREIGKEE